MILILSHNIKDKGIEDQEIQKIFKDNLANLIKTIKMMVLLLLNRGEIMLMLNKIRIMLLKEHHKKIIVKIMILKKSQRKKIMLMKEHERKKKLKVMLEKYISRNKI